MDFPSQLPQPVKKGILGLNFLSSWNTRFKGWSQIVMGTLFIIVGIILAITFGQLTALFLSLAGVIVILFGIINLWAAKKSLEVGEKYYRN